MVVHCGKFGALARVRPVSMKLAGFSGSKKPDRFRLPLMTPEICEPCWPVKGTTAICSGRRTPWSISTSMGPVCWGAGAGCVWAVAGPARTMAATEARRRCRRMKGLLK
ncbi:hypothetical protein D3C80_1145400 [compost metagenome]